MYGAWLSMTTFRLIKTGNLHLRNQKQNESTITDISP